MGYSEIVFKNFRHPFDIWGKLSAGSRQVNGSVARIRVSSMDPG